MQILKYTVLFFIVGFVFLLPAKLVGADVSLPPGFTRTVLEEGLNTPVAMDFAPDGRLFVTEKEGNLRIIKNGQLLSEPFLTVPVNDFSERGLLGITFDPDFETNRYLYVYYTRANEPIKNRVSRFTASESNPDVVEAASEVILLDDISSDAGNHNAGALHFGLDGKLYISVGDGGQTSTNAQDLSTLSGKILRINNDGSIPNDNPFVGILGAKEEIWALGLRNPFTFALHPTSGKMMINDVGANVWEEVNLGNKGANYGWPTCEGACDDPDFTNPIYQNFHPQMVALTGASFYTGDQFPSDYKNHYFFGDYVKNVIKKLDYINGNTVTDFAIDVASPVDIREGPDGSLYYLSIGEGKIYKITFGSPIPTPTDTPTPTPAENQPPTATISSPVDNMMYNAGDTIHYAAEATDPEDGVLSDTAFSWTIIFHHDTHTHPFLGPITGVSSGDFQIPQTGETSSNVWYEISLTVIDSDGEQHTTSVDIFPRKVTLTLNSTPAGLQVTLDGQPQTTPFTTESVVGFNRILGASTPQTIDGRTYAFNAWSDSGSQTHTVETPSSNTTYTAQFDDVTPPGNGLLGTYFTHDNFSGITVQRIDPEINFDWEIHEPADGITPEYYSAHWTGKIYIPITGDYTFYTTTDDGVRLWIDDTKIIDKWQDQSATEHQGMMTLEGGKNYSLRMDYYNAPWVGSAKFAWEGPGISKQIVPQSYLYSNTASVGNGLLGNYFDNLNFAGVKKTRIDTTVDFDWGTNPPLMGIGADTFSTRWTGYIVPEFSENYTFTTKTDDGTRLWVNHALVIDKWQDQSATEHEGSLMLQAGVKYPVTLEYYENGWDAFAKLYWQSSSQSKQIIPQDRLYSW